VPGQYNGAPGGIVAANLVLAIVCGFVAGVGLWRVDRRLAPRFAESAGFDPASVVPNLAIGAYLIPSVPIAVVLLSVRDGIGVRLAYQAVVATVLLWVASIDWRWRIIPNRITYLAVPIAFLPSPLAHSGSALHAYEFALIGFVTAGGIFALFFLLSVLIYHHGGAFGLGDVKLAAFVGVALGYPAAIAAVFFATFAGALFALAWGVAYRSRKAGFPYGPAIAAGAILAMLVAPSG